MQDTTPVGLEHQQQPPGRNAMVYKHEEQQQARGLGGQTAVAAVQQRLLEEKPHWGTALADSAVPGRAVWRAQQQPAKTTGA